MNRTLLVLMIGLLALTASSGAHAEPRDFPHPAELRPDVEFWKRIYSEVATDGGLIHDTRDLRVVYEVVKLPRGLSTRARQRHTDKIKKKYKAILQTLAKGKRSGLTREERRVLALFGPNVSNATLKGATSRVRFQLGQADKFRAGVIRSGRYKPHVLETLRKMDLPLEIAHLPHVESSYTPTVYSRVGAAGLWQFTRSTGRRFMQVDHVVDERLDPYRASVAAARLLEQNHRVTGSWPLAITAYNHGAAGMRRAARKLGTTDIVKVVRKYRSRTFGFASRNFYVEFLAANSVASNPEKYFGPLVLDSPIDYDTTELPFYAKATDLAAAIGIDPRTLKEANPGLRPAVWKGSKRIPKGYSLRIPRSRLAQPLSVAVSKLPKAQRHARQTRDASYTVRRGDTLSTIARRHGVRMSELVALNGLKSRNRIRIGQKLRLPGDGGKTTKVAYKADKPAAAKKPASKNKAATQSVKIDRPAALPDDGIYRVRRGDNLTEIADRFGLSVSELVSLNGLRSRHRIAIGQKLRVTATPPKTEPKTVTAPSKPVIVADSDGAAAPSPATTPKGIPGARPKTTPQESTPPEPQVAAINVPEARSAPVYGPVAEMSDESEATDADPDSDESAVEPSPGLLADPSDYTVASNETIRVQPNETLGHYAEWLGLRTSRLRQINKLRFGQDVGIQQKLKLDFSKVSPAVFEQVRIEYHRAIQEAFFAEWEIEGTATHRVGPGDSLWTLSTRRFDVPIWLLRQYNPDVKLEALSRGTELTIPKLRQRTSDARTVGDVAKTEAAG